MVMTWSCGVWRGMVDELQSRDLHVTSHEAYLGFGRERDPLAPPLSTSPTSPSSSVPYSLLSRNR